MCNKSNDTRNTNGAKCKSKFNPTVELIRWNFNANLEHAITHLIRIYDDTDMSMMTSALSTADLIR